MSSKVQFVDDIGNVFFQCSSPEARIAMKAVEENRLRVDGTHKESQRLTQEFKELLDNIVKVSITDTQAYASDGLDANIIADIFKDVESQNVMVTHIFLGAIRYADLRKWDRDIMDIETKKWILLTGWMATIWGAKVVVCNIIPNDEVVAVSSWKECMRKGTDVVMRRKLVFSGKPQDVPEEDRMKAIEELLLKVARKVGV